MSLGKSDRPVLSGCVFTVLAIGLRVAVISWQRSTFTPLSMWTPAIAALLTYVLVERKAPWDAQVRHRVFGNVRRWPIARAMIPLRFAQRGPQ